MSDMVELTIDGRRVAAKARTTILNAALQNGIYIPHICYDRRLAPFGGCRLCVVEVEGQRKLRAACSSPVEPDMVVRTDSEKLRKARKTVIELILIHHPLDCPICDKAGECMLQEMAFRYGSTESRFKAARRHAPEITEAPLIERNPNRCILCGKCVKVCKEHQGVGAIDFIGRGFPVKISPAFEETLDCEFCGQCIDICPVGALGSKPYRFRSRVWFMDEVNTVCPYCGCGCTVTLGVREGKIVRSVGKDGVGLSKGDLCGRGRFGFDYVTSEKRLKTPLVREGGELREATWEEAVARVREKLGAVASAHGPEAIGGIGSPRCSVEDNYMFQKFMREALGTPNVDSIEGFGYLGALRAVKEAFGVTRLPIEIDAPDSADAVLVVESDVTSTHPIFGLKVLRAARDRGAHLIVADPKMTKLSRHATDWLRIAPASGAAFLQGMMRVVIDKGLHREVEDVDEGLYARENPDIPNYEALRASVEEYTPERVEELTGIEPDRLVAAATAFARARKRLLYLTFGSAENTKGSDLVLAAANLLMLVGSGPESLQIPATYANSLGVVEAGVRPDAGPGHAPVAKPGLSIAEMLYAERTPIKALYIMGENPVVSFPRAGMVEAALKGLDFLVVQDIMLSATAQLADVVLPALSWSEKEGTYLGAMGIAQETVKCLSPTGDAVADWQIMRNIARDMQVDLGAPDFASLKAEADEAIGFGREHGPATFSFTPIAPDRGERPEGEYPLAMVTGILMQHSGSLTTISRSLGSVVADAYVQIHPSDAARLGVHDEGYVRLASRRGEVYVKARVTDEVLPGMVFVPAHFQHTRINALTLLPANGGAALVAARVEPAS